MDRPNAALTERAGRFSLLRAAQRALARCMHPAVLDPLREQGRQLLIQLYPQPLGGNVLGRATHDGAGRQSVACGGNDLDNNPFIARLAGVLTAILGLGHKLP